MKLKPSALLLVLAPAVFIVLFGIGWYFGAPNPLLSPSVRPGNTVHPSMTISKPNITVKYFADFLAHHKFAFGAGAVIATLVVVAAVVALILWRKTNTVISSTSKADVNLSEHDQELSDSTFGILTGVLILFSLVGLMVYTFLFKKSPENKPSPLEVKPIKPQLSAPPPGASKKKLVDALKNFFEEDLKPPKKVAPTKRKESVTIKHNGKDYKVRKLVGKNRGRYYEYMRQHVEGLFLIGCTEDDTEKCTTFTVYRIPDSPEFEQLSDEDADFIYSEIDRSPIVRWHVCDLVREFRTHIQRISAEMNTYPANAVGPSIPGSPENFTLAVGTTRTMLNCTDSTYKALYRYVYNLHGSKLDFTLQRSEVFKDEICVAKLPQLHNIPMDKLTKLNLAFANGPTVIDFSV